MRKPMHEEKLNPAIFKAYDIRGVYPKDLNEYVVTRVVDAFCVFLVEENKERGGIKKIILGHDARLSGPALHEAAKNALIASGVDVFDIGLQPVDVYYYALASEDADGGVFITASHNPREWNGLNLARRRAKPISSETGLSTIRDLALKSECLPVPERVGVTPQLDPLPHYIRFLSKFINPRELPPLTIVADGNFGISAQVFKKLVAELHLPITVIGINDEPDGNFPKGPPNPLLPENRHEISERVVKEKANLGVAWDADGDRVYFVDEKGFFLEGYFITALLAGEMLKNNPGATIITDPRLVWATEEAVQENGGRLVIARPGLSLIAERMEKENAVFAGEMSGHFYFKETFNRDNGMLPILLILGMMVREKKPLSELHAPYTSKYFVSGEINFEVHDIETVMKVVSAHYYEGEIEHIDGLSVSFPEWRFNLRASNTEPLLRLNVEAKNPALLKEKTAELTRMIG